MHSTRTDTGLHLDRAQTLTITTTKAAARVKSGRRGRRLRLFMLAVQGGKPPVLGKPKAMLPVIVRLVPLPAGDINASLPAISLVLLVNFHPLLAAGCMETVLPGVLKWLLSIVKLVMLPY